MISVYRLTHNISLHIKQYVILYINKLQTQIKFIVMIIGSTLITYTSWTYQWKGINSKLPLYTYNISPLFACFLPILSFQKWVNAFKDPLIRVSPVLALSYIHHHNDVPNYIHIHDIHIYIRKLLLCTESKFKIQCTSQDAYTETLYTEKLYWSLHE